MSRTLRAEVLRFFGTRWWLAHLIAALACGFGLVGLIVAVGPQNATPPMPGLDTGEGVSAMIQFAQLTLFVPAVLGTFAITSEYRHRTIGTTFLAEPRRGRVMTAKLITHGLIGLGYGIILAGGIGGAMVLGGLARDGLAADGLASSLARLAVAAAVHALIGVAIGALVRHQIAGIVVVAGYFYLVEPLLMLVPGVNAVYALLPGGATASLTRTTWLSEVMADQLGSSAALLLPAWTAGLVLLGYAVVASVIAVAWPLRRDLG